MSEILFGNILSFTITYFICWMNGYGFGWNFKTVVIFLILDVTISHSMTLRDIDILYKEIEILKAQE